MKVIIVGIGKLGDYLAKELVAEKHDVTIIDTKFNNRNNIINNEDLNYICGNGLDSNILLEAGISNSDLLISVMDKDENNVMCCLLGKKLGVKHTIARVRKPEYSNFLTLVKNDIGLSMTINPDLLTARHIAGVLSIPSALDVTPFFKGRLQLVSLKVNEKCPLIGLTIKALSNKVTKDVIVCAVEREDEVIIPKGNIKFKEGDIIHVTGIRKDIQKLIQYAGYMTNKMKKVMIIGGSSTSVYLANILNDMNIKSTIVEFDSKRCTELTELAPNSLIINGDATDENILLEEDIKNMNGFVALTSIDEENVILSMFAKLNGVSKVITKTSHINLGGVLEKTNIDSIVTPHKIVANQIVTYIRAMQNGEDNSCESIYKFGNNKFEVLEFIVKNSFKALNKPLKDISFKNNIVIAAIMRGKNIIYPGGKDVIEEGDTIVVVNGNKNINEINDIMESNYE